MKNSANSPYRILILSLLGLFTLACSLSGLPIIGGDVEPTPPPAPTPIGDTIFFTAPYAIALTPETTIPGTQLHYIGPNGELHRTTIDGLAVDKRIEDSFNWKGLLARGIHGEYNLRLELDRTGQLFANGLTRLSVFNPNPIELPLGTAPIGDYYFSNIGIHYVVPAGQTMPGTTLIFQGHDEQMATFSGTAGHPFRSLNDSLIWLGQLADNIFIQYDVTVVSLNEFGLGLTGTAQLWVID